MKYYNEYDGNYLYYREDFEIRNVCFLVLAAVVMKADSIKIKHSELNFMKQLFLEKCGERIAKAYILKLRDILKEEKYDMEYTFELFRRYTDYRDYKATAETMFALASIDGEIGIPEFLALWDIVCKLGVETCDILSVINRYRSRISRRVVFKIEFGELCYRIIDTEDNNIANDSGGNSSVQKAYKLLEIDENATDSQVKEAYRKMAKKYHPDCHNDSIKEWCEEKMKELNGAIETIMKSRETTVSKRERA